MTFDVLGYTIGSFSQFLDSKSVLLHLKRDLYDLKAAKSELCGDLLILLLTDVGDM